MRRTQPTLNRTLASFAIGLSFSLLVACGDDDGLLDGGASDAATPDATLDSSLTDAPVPFDAGLLDAQEPDGALDAATDSSIEPSGDCYRGSPTITGSEGNWTVMTPHYELRAQSDRARAERFARMLEAAYTAYGRFFGTSTEARPFLVKFLRDDPSFQAELRADGVVSSGGIGGFYSPDTDTAYLHDQPTRYYTRVLLLHEAAHQFQASVNGDADLPFWLEEGIAEYLGRHHWDGSCIDLGVLPLLSQEDTPLDALRESEAGTQLTSVVDGASASRPISESIVRFLNLADRRELFRRFLRDAESGTAVPAAFRAAFGEPSALETPWRSALSRDQEPLSIVYLEWTHLGPETLEAVSDFFSIARLKVSVNELSLRFPAPAPSSSAGVLLSFQDTEHWEALVVRGDGSLSRFDVNGGAIWNNVGSAPAATAEGYAVRARRLSETSVEVTVNGVATTQSIRFPLTFGPAIDSGSVRFNEIRWR